MNRHLDHRHEVVLPSGQAGVDEIHEADVGEEQMLVSHPADPVVERLDLGLGHRPGPEFRVLERELVT